MEQLVQANPNIPLMVLQVLIGIHTDMSRPGPDFKRVPPLGTDLSVAPLAPLPSSVLSPPGPPPQSPSQVGQQNAQKWVA